MSLRDQYKLALEAKGWKHDTSYRTAKYIVMTKAGEEKKFFLGTNGALRFGRSVAESHGCSDALRLRLQAFGKAVRSNPSLEDLGL